MNPPAANRVRLTTLAHNIVAEVLQPGDYAIDATAGHGADTQHLARCVGAEGEVLALDIQAEAIENASCRLAEASLANVELLQRDHVDLAGLRPEWRGQVGAVMFNLGYLPHGDPSIKTQITSTETAIAASLDLLRSGGVLTAIAYTGHPGGEAEKQAVERLLSNLSAEFVCEEQASEPGSVAGPHLFVVRRVG